MRPSIRSALREKTVFIVIGTIAALSAASIVGGVVTTARSGPLRVPTRRS
jgi:hypothetical protein